MKMKRVRSLFTVLSCIVSALLVSFYIVTLIQGLNPHPGNGYRQFYLEEGLYSWAGQNGITVQRGKTLHFDSQTPADDQIVGRFCFSEDFPYDESSEWTYVDGVGYCINAWQSDLMFELEPGVDYEAEFVFEPEQPGGEVTFFSGDEKLAFVKLDETPKSVVFPIPAPQETNERLRLVLVLGGDVETPLPIREVTFR